MARRTALSFLLPVLAIAAVLIVVGNTAQAGPITGGGGHTPFVKLGVYQGIVTIISPGGGNIMTLGNAGRDITSTSDLYFRPGGIQNDNICFGGTNNGGACTTDLDCPGAGSCLQQATSIGNVGYAEAGLFVTGSICLHGSGSADCRNVWPASGGAGDPYWTTATVGSLTTLTPVTSGSPTVQSLRIGSPANPVPPGNGPAFQVYANYAGPALHVLTDAYTNDYDPVTYNPIGYGTVVISGSLQAGQLYSLTYYDGVSFYGYVNPWTSADSYAHKTFYPNDPNTDFSGLSNIDADTFDSASLTGMLFPNNGNLYVRNLYFASPPWGSSATVTSICIKTTASGLCVSGATIGKACTSSADCGGGTCQTMCTASQQSCAVDQIHSATPPDTGKFCNAFSGKLFTKSCRNTSTNRQYQVGCTIDADCSSLGAGVTCQNTTCYDYSTCSAPAARGIPCKVGDATYGDSYCNGFTAGSTCTVPALSCPGGGGCRANSPSGAVIPGGGGGQVYAGFCYNTIPCTDDAQCGGSAGSSNYCSYFGACTKTNTGDVNDPIAKHCVGGTRNNKRCDEAYLCIGGSADSLYDNHDQANIDACHAAGGEIGNSIDYCPGGGTCVADLPCQNQTDCYYGEVCSRGLVVTVTNPPSLGGYQGCSVGTTCDTWCHSQPINRCRGATTVFGTAINACSTSGFSQDLTYTGGTCTLGYQMIPGAQFQCVCNVNASPRDYVSGTTGSGELCTQRFE